MTANREKTNDRRVGGWLLLGLVVIFGGVYVAGYVFTSDRVPRGTTVAGVEIGGMKPVAAQRRLAEGLQPRVDQPITVGVDGGARDVAPEQAGLSVDLEQSVAQAGGGRSWNPSRMWNYVAGGDDYEAVVSVDEATLERQVAEVAEGAERPAREGDVVFEDGVAETRPARVGYRVDTEQAADAIAAAYLDPDTAPVELPVEPVEPEITDEDLAAAMEEFADPAMSAPVTFRLEGEEAVVQPTVFGDALSMAPRDGRLAPELDEKALQDAIAPAMRSVVREPTPATVKLVGGEPTVVPGRRGVGFDPAAVNEQFLALVVQRGKNRTLEVESVVDRPDFTTEDAEKLKITEAVSSFTTSYPHADYRNTNLGQAARNVDGTVLRPGETFSMNDVVGERTAENGFAKGFIISDGVYLEDYGGGVSQVATTLFNAMFFAGLEDVEHKPHSFYIDRYPVGREATVVWGAVDLRFKNTTPYGVLIKAGIEPSTPTSSGEMTVTMWSTDYWDIEAGKSQRYDITEEETRYIQDPECVPNEGYGGFDIDVFRYFYRAGSDQLDHREKFHTTYTPSDTVVCGPDPDGSDSDN